ncbi:helix-turn-helix domain-containing protein [Methanogenium marinum]|uniref:Helix-turn-helix domain-containing protein n=1 Tax=Methanogenium marinum TaxID=348610 RepID=A0A9Q4KVF8_9EURY|nr:helix-turn-helix domain-containing protein [Methanogenium marinum]MDE4908196.1 helix-turn-helix domain-containing protein [Methanogenium marinum]
MDLPFDETQANEQFIRLSKKYGLNPVMLKEILMLRNKGFNNAQIAQHTGINRNTVNKYVSALNEMQTEDLLALIALFAIIGIGIAAIAALFGNSNGGN